jgi:hypothetical protein
MQLVNELNLKTSLPILPAITEKPSDTLNDPRIIRVHTHTQNPKSAFITRDMRISYDQKQFFSPQNFASQLTAQRAAKTLRNLATFDRPRPQNYSLLFYFSSQVSALVNRHRSLLEIQSEMTPST